MAAAGNGFDGNPPPCSFTGIQLVGGLMQIWKIIVEKEATFPLSRGYSQLKEEELTA
jgi:hypothetical protein